MVEPTSPSLREIWKLRNFLGTALEYLGILFEFTLRASFGVVAFGFVHTSCLFLSEDSAASFYRPICGYIRQAIA